MNSSNEPATTSQSELTSSGSWEEKQIRLKTAPGSVQYLVQLDGLNSTMRRSARCITTGRLRKTGLKNPQAWASQWINNLSKSSAIENTVETIRLDQPLPTTAIFTRSVQANIQVKEALVSLFAPGRSVERMGHHGWRGRITAMEGDKAYVNWGRSRQWIDCSELYPLDRQGMPILPNQSPNLLEVARRARANLGLE